MELLSDHTQALRDVDATGELATRPCRAPDHGAENAALVDLLAAMADAPGGVLQQLADAALALCNAGSAGISLEEPDNAVFRWHATAGAWRNYVGATMPRGFSPCGVVLDRNELQLMREPIRAFGYIAELQPPVAEVLLLPFHRDGEPIGTLWIVAHDETRKFDAEDVRLMTSLTRFAAAATHALAAAREAAAATEREQALLRQTEVERTNLNAIFVRAPTTIAILRGPDFRIQSANPEALRVWKRREEEVLDRPFFDVFPALRGDGQVWQTALDEVMQRGVAHVGTETRAAFDHEDGTGEETAFNFIVSPVHAVDGAVDGILLVALDVTQQVRAREELDRLRLRAERANTAKDEFLAMLGHELRNPLSAVRNAIETARLDASRRTRALEIAGRQSDQLGRLVDDLLDVARITRGRITLRKEPIVLADTLRRSIDSVRAVVEERKHSLRVTLPAEPVRLEADMGRIEQIVGNLIANAAKYTAPGGAIELVAERDGADVCIRVRDNGVGIAPDVLPRVFDLFAQADQGLDRAYGGLGIGLTLARRLAELHGGSIEARSDGDGKGAEFVVRLPVLPASHDEAAAAVAKPARREHAHAAHVLVVEDNRDAGESLVMVLEMLGHQARLRFNGSGALDAAREQVPNLMLVDIGLPDMNGYEVAQAVRRDAALQDVILVAVTGYGRDEDKDRARQAGFDHHIVKPVDLAVLRGLLDRISAGIHERNQRASRTP